MIVSPPRVPRTAPYHMKAHESFVPAGTIPLDAELYQIGVYGVQGAQHNPSVFLKDDTLHVNVRVLDGRGPFSTNYIARVDDDYTLVGAKPMAPKNTSVVRGPIRTPLSMNFPRCEDLRLFNWRGKLWAIGCTHDGANPPGWIRQALLELSPDGHEIVQINVLGSNRHEKNWMPCVDGEKLAFVYSTDPLIVIDVDSPNKIPSAQGVPETLGSIRGGTQLVEDDGGWLALVHQVFKPPRLASGYNPLLGGFEPVMQDPIAGGAPMVYLHYFARFAKDFSDVKLSAPFYFRALGVEFAAGLVRHGDRFVASFGVADKEAWLALFDGKRVEEMFAMRGEK